jgi:hypothetical protein
MRIVPFFKILVYTNVKASQMVNIFQYFGSVDSPDVGTICYTILRHILANFKPNFHAVEASDITFS